MVRLHVWNQLVRQLVVGIERAEVLLAVGQELSPRCMAAPRAGVQLVNLHRAVVIFVAGAHPALIVPVIAVQIVHARCRARAQLAAKCERIRTVRHPAVARGDAVLIHLSLADVPRVQEPHAVRTARHIPVAPVVELAADRDARRIRRIHRKISTAVLTHMRTHGQIRARGVAGQIIVNKLFIQHGKPPPIPSA